MEQTEEQSESTSHVQGKMPSTAEACGYDDSEATTPAVIADKTARMAL